MQRYPESGWVEQDPDDIWLKTLWAIDEAKGRANAVAADIPAAGIANQRETTLVINRDNGEAVGPAVMRQCRRTVSKCDDIRREGLDEVVRDRTGLESIGFQVYDVVRAMNTAARLRPMELRVDGGAAANDFVAQFLADVLGANVSRPQHVETTGFGAACLAGLAIGFWRDRSEIASLRRDGQVFMPSIGRKRRGSVRRDWRPAVGRSRRWLG